MNYNRQFKVHNNFHVSINFHIFINPFKHPTKYSEQSSSYFPAYFCSCCLLVTSVLCLWLSKLQTLCGHETTSEKLACFSFVSSITFNQSLPFLSLLFLCNEHHISLIRQCEGRVLAYSITESIATPNQYVNLRRICYINVYNINSPFKVLLALSRPDNNCKRTTK